MIFLAFFILMSKNTLTEETNFRARLIGVLSDRDVEIHVVDTKSNRLVDDFVTTSRNGQVVTSLPIKRKSIYRIRVTSFGMLTHTFLIQMSPGRSVNMGRINAFLGDVNGDNVIDKRDLDLIARYRGVISGSKRWTFGDADAERFGEDCDLNNDKVIDDKDYKIAFDNVGKRGSRK